MNKKVEIIKTKNTKINPLEYSKIILTGKTARVFTSYDNNIKKHSYWRAIKNNKIAINHYINYCKVRNIAFITKNIYYRTNETGSFYEFKKIERNKTTTKEQNLSSLYKSIKKAKDIINTNITKNTIIITITYAENMKDTKKLYFDLNLFIKNLSNYWNNERKLKEPLKWFLAKEPQERGAWHAHILIFCKNKIVLPNEKIAYIWGKGFTKTERIKKKKNAGAYITSYLTNLEPEPNETKESKKNKKGKRLFMYPSHFKIFTHSRNLKKPIIMPATLHGENVAELEYKGFKISKYQPKKAYKVISTLTGEQLKCYNYENYEKE